MVTRDPYCQRSYDAWSVTYCAPSGLFCCAVLVPRALPWAVILRPFRA